MTLVVSPSAIEVITRPIPWFNTYKLHAVGEFTYEHLRQSQSYDKLACIRERLLVTLWNGLTHQYYSPKISRS